MITSNYATGIDSNISRVTALTDSSGTLENYTYMGLGTIVTRARNSAAGVDLTYVKLTAEVNGDSQDQYIGLDRFGRVIDQRWLKTSNSTNTDRYGYGYDRNGNRTYRENKVSTVNSELYVYDNLDRVTSFQRGTLNAAKTALTGAATRSQSWSLDSVGNSNSVTTDSVVQNRTHNRQNELTVLGTTNLAFDNNGNLTTDQTGKTLRWDAWNRLVEQKNGITSQIVFAYDALGRRVKEGTTSVYFNATWQMIEERSSTGTLQVQYTWSNAYIDAMITRDKDTDANGITDQRHYVMQDANWNVTGLLDATGVVVQRFNYDAYGKRSALTAAWAAGTDTFAFAQGFAGGKANSVTGRIHFRNREYDADLMRWLNPDPIGFDAGDMNFYQYVSGNTLTKIDPSGLLPWGELGGQFTNNSGSPVEYATDLDSNFIRVGIGRFLNPIFGSQTGPGWAYYTLPPGATSPNGVDVDYFFHNEKWWKIEARFGRDIEMVIEADGSVVRKSYRAGDGNSTMKFEIKNPYIPPEAPNYKKPNGGNPPPSKQDGEEGKPPKTGKPVSTGKPSGKCVTVENPFVS